MLTKEKSYSQLGAKELLKQGKNVSVGKGVVHGFGPFAGIFLLRKDF